MITILYTFLVQDKLALLTHSWKLDFCDTLHGLDVNQVTLDCLVHLCEVLCEDIIAFSPPVYLVDDSHCCKKGAVLTILFAEKRHVPEFWELNYLAFLTKSLYEYI